ncbi:cytochrome c oxidase subunit I [Notoacmeibacter ruber]|uniref:cytochrome-c oxidase n=2 Tax=Notoacmeibacter ruber TaxID=2670375 RepID=A0A3L7JCN2_9HYPH|nr:cytochrome c oxidase subunit I [Notoacmeibacter ruber]
MSEVSDSGRNADKTRKEGKLTSFADDPAVAPAGTYPPTEEMLSEPVDPEWSDASADRLRAIWKGLPGWRYWKAVNNSEVGIWYSLACLFFMLCAGAMALIMRVQLAVPGADIVSADTYNQLYTMHGSAMMFLFAVPMFEAIAILLLPAFLGARDMPFPRLSAYGFWCFAIGGLFVISSPLFGIGPDGGWFMYPPYSTKFGGIGADVWLLGLSFIEVASIAAAVELIVGVLKCRPPGMRVNIMPLYAWYVLVVGAMILFAFPPLIAGDLLFELERALGWPFFDPDRGGDPMLWQHLFWIFGHPEVYIVFLPSIAIAAMVVPTAARQPIVGYSWIVLSAVGTGFISFGLWVHHMFTTGLPNISLGFFSAASEAVVIPTGIQLFAFVATLLVGRVRMSVPMLYIAGSLAIFTAGGLTGVMVALAPFDWQAHDSYFVVAHLHYTLFGGMVFPVMAGVSYFYPFFTKKKMSNTLGRIAFWLTFVGFNVTFLPMHLTGLMGMPRRVFTYLPGLGWDGLNLISTVGAFVMAAGILTFVWDVLRPKGNAPFTERNPWDAGTLEWSHDVPDQAWGVRSIPHVVTRYPIWQQPKIVERMDAGRFYLPDAEEAKRETLVTSILDARPIQVMRVTGPTWKTHLTAAFTGLGFILPTFHIYWPAAFFLLCAGAAVIWWLWTSTTPVPEKDMKDVGLGLKLPVYASGPASAGWWGVWITMLGDMTAFASLVFGMVFFWTASETFITDDTRTVLLPWLSLATLAVGCSWALTVAARETNRRGRGGIAKFCLTGAFVLTIVGAGALAISFWASDLEPTTHSFPAICGAITIWTLAHLGLGLTMQGYGLAGMIFGKLTTRYDADLWNITLFWHFMLVTMAAAAFMIGVFPILAGEV